jgi:hypothetical protein
MASTTLSETVAIDVLAAVTPARSGSASRVQNQGQRDMKVWFNTTTAPALSTKPDFVCAPGLDFAVDGTQKVWCHSGGETYVGVTAQVYS